jgi:hypothetical protein
VKAKEQDPDARALWRQQVEALQAHRLFFISQCSLHDLEGLKRLPLDVPAERPSLEIKPTKMPGKSGSCKMPLVCDSCP